MRFVGFILSLAVFGSAIALGQQSGSKSKTGSKKAVTTKAVTKGSGSTGVKTSAAKTSALKASPSKKPAGTRRPVRRVASAPRQAAPTQDRYKEIQQALADKGYLKSQPSGVWDADSVDAMKRFQTDRKLDPSGKLTAASIIDLGLGPKREIASAPVKGPGEAVPDPPKIETAPPPQP